MFIADGLRFICGPAQKKLGRPDAFGAPIPVYLAEEIATEPRFGSTHSEAALGLTDNRGTKGARGVLFLKEDGELKNLA
jgi:hypothetical protein